MPTRPATILLTGFGPFPGVRENASGTLVLSLARLGRATFPGTRIEAAVLPTEWEAGTAKLGHVLRVLQPDVCIHFGVSRRARGFEVETRARNVAGRFPDAAGVIAGNACLRSDAPAELAATLPLGRILARLRRRGLPGYLSRDAGTYLCNAILFQSLTAARCGSPTASAGFVHIPARLARGCARSSRSPNACSLDWASAVQGGLEIVAASLRRPPPAARLWLATRWPAQH